MKFNIQNPAISIIKEPMVILGNNTHLPDQKLGIKLCGIFQELPNDININIGIIGDRDSIDSTKEFLSKIQREINRRKK